MAPWSVQKLELQAPSLKELVNPISTALSSNFHTSTVEIITCPDLRAPPYNLAAPGLCGNPRVADIGGPPNLAPTPKLDRRYTFKDMTDLIQMGSKGSVIAASGGPFHVLGTCCEGILSWSYDGTEVVNRSWYAKVSEKGECVCEKLEAKEFGLMGNLFGSDGSPGDVLKITAKVRTGKNNFTATTQKALKDTFGDRLVSMGGVFVIKKGKANLHVMPDFSATPLKTQEEVEKWLRFFDMSAPLVCLSVFHSCDPGLDLRMEHTHCFSEHGEGGHYHDDITPEEVEYEAYFNVAEVLYRIDRPKS